MKDSFLGLPCSVFWEKNLGNEIDLYTVYVEKNQKTVSYLFLGEADRKHARNMMNVIDVIDLAI